MSSAAESKNAESIAAQVQTARRAARASWRGLSTDERNQILLTAADLLEKHEADILNANQQDCESLEQQARELGSRQLFAALLKRLRTSSAGIKDMAKQVRDVAGSKILWPRARHHGTR